MSDGTDNSRAVDVYAGTMANDLTAPQLADLLEASANRGAVKALKSIGLDDEMAGPDLKDLRSWLISFRTAKKVTISAAVLTVSTTLKNGFRVVKWIALIWIINHFMDSEIGKDLVKKYIDPMGL